MLIAVLVLAALLNAEPSPTDRNEFDRFAKQLGGSDADFEQAAPELIKGGRKAVPALVQALKNGQASERMRASYALDQIGAQAVEAIPALIAALEDENEHVRRNAANALGRMGTAATGAVTPLMRAAGRKGDLDLRRNSLRSLAAIGPGAADAFPLFVETLKDEDLLCRADAVRGLLRSPRPLPEVAPLAIAMLADDNYYVLLEAKQGLFQLGPKVLPFLGRALKDKNPLVRSHSAEILQVFATDAVPALPALTEPLGDAKPGVQIEAAKAIGAIGPGAKSATAALLPLLRRKEVRLHAAAALAAIGPESNDAVVPVLIELLDDASVETRWAAADTLATIGPGARSAIPALTKALNDKGQFVGPWDGVCSVSSAAAAALKAIEAPSGPRRIDDPRQE